MKKVTEKAIINIDDNLFDNKIVFDLPVDLKFENEIDIAEELKSCRNDNITYKKDYKLWNEVYSPKEEFRIFQSHFDLAINKNKKIHISNISLQEEIELVKNLYLDL